MTTEVMRIIVQQLRANGLEANLEYPGWISLPTNDERSRHTYAIGDANASQDNQLHGQRTDEDGGAVPDSIDDLVFIGTPEDISRQITGWYRSTR